MLFKIFHFISSLFFYHYFYFIGQLKAISHTLNDIGRNLTLQKLIGMSKSKTRFHHEPQLIWLMQGMCFYFECGNINTLVTDGPGET